jgi:Polysaccharide lyase
MPWRCFSPITVAVLAAGALLAGSAVGAPPVRVSMTALPGAVAPGTTSPGRIGASGRHRGKGTLFYAQRFDGGSWQCPLCVVDSSAGTATVALNGRHLDLTVNASTGGPNASSNAASLSVCGCNPRPWTGAEGRDVWYAVKVFFPSSSQFPTGNGQDVVEWHTSDKVGTGPTSSFMGVGTDYPVTSSPGVNPRLTFWVRGGYFDSSGRHITEKTISMRPRSLLLNHWYSIQFHMRWSADPAKAVSDWYVDGVQRAHVTGYANLFRFDDGTTDQTGVGLYNYRLKSSWPSTISFDDFKVGSTQSAVR